MASGGSRPGAGRPKGSTHKATRQEKVSFTELAKQYAPQALQALVDVMMTGASEAARVSAANSIIERAYGRVQVQEPEQDTEARSLTINVSASAPIGEIRVTRSDS